MENEDNIDLNKINFVEFKLKKIDIQNIPDLEKFNCRIMKKGNEFYWVTIEEKDKPNHKLQEIKIEENKSRKSNSVRASHTILFPWYAPKY
ncbi:MAG: hypothetical protein HRK26_03220 [Rickettsiaceae bacterium H1]|nr:hypothetical protein [Rickettsiaceae bacterium H1]